MSQTNERELGVPEAGETSSPPKPEKPTIILVGVDDEHDHSAVIQRLIDAAPGLEPVMAPVRDIPALTEFAEEVEHYHLPEGCSREEYQEQMKNPEIAKAVEDATKSIEEHVPGIEEPVNPIHQNADGKWYFWDEIWVNEIGPYDTREEANTAINEYAADLEKEHQYRKLHPHRFPRKKLHPHKRAISSEDRRALTAGGNAFWLKGKK